MYWYCNAKYSAFYLCGLSRACLSHQHKRLITHQDVSEALSVLPDRQLQPLLQDLVVAGRVGQVGEGVDLLLYGGLLEEASTACSWVVRHPGKLHVSAPVMVSIPVTAPVPRPLVAVSVPVAVTPVRERCMRLRFDKALPHKLTNLTYHRYTT